MIIVMGHAQLGAGEIDRLSADIKTQLAATNAETGCHHYGFSRDVLDPDRMIISERWENQAAIDLHFASPHMAAFNAALGTAKVLGLDIKSYDLETGEIKQLMGG
jgi:quinol monooxygenase YgiN